MNFCCVLAQRRIRSTKKKIRTVIYSQITSFFDIMLLIRINQYHQCECQPKINFTNHKKKNCWHCSECFNYRTIWSDYKEKVGLFTFFVKIRNIQKKIYINTYISRVNVSSIIFFFKNCRIIFINLMTNMNSGILSKFLLSGGQISSRFFLEIKSVHDRSKITSSTKRCNFWTCIINKNASLLDMLNLLKS